MNPAPPKITTERKSRSLRLPFDFFSLDSENAFPIVDFSCGIVEEKLRWYLHLLGLEQQTPERVVVTPRQFVTEPRIAIKRYSRQSFSLHDRVGYALSSTSVFVSSRASG